jgi:hypothetical protein
MARTYEISTRDGQGHEHVRHYTSDDPLTPGSVIVLGRYWLVESVEEAQARAVPARYGLTLRHPDGHEEAGAFRRFRADAPEVGHQLTTLEDGAPISWSVVDQRLARDEAGEAFLEFVAERDFGERESLPDHQLEHAVERGDDGDNATRGRVASAEAAGSAVELVALDPGETADWEEAARFLDALVIDEISEGLLELCGVHPGRDPERTWLETVERRLGEDLELFRADVEGPHDQIEEWDFRGGRIFAAVGDVHDDSNPLSGYGWMCRLVDADVLGAAGFQRVRKAELL